MSEHESPQINPESKSIDYESLYQAAHPDAVQDRAKAEAMARATDGEETAIVENRRQALDHASQVGERDGYNHTEAAYDHAEAARDAREAADEKAETVGDVYEMTKDL